MIFGSSSKTAPEDRIGLLQKSAYAVGMFVNNLQAAALPAMAVILNLGLKVDPVLVGLLAAIPRAFDALTDPVMGYISDNTRSRWGRRRPYIFWGAIASGVIFALMWQLPAGHSQAFYFWVFLTASLAFFGAYTVYATPFVAFGYEMTPDYHERTRLHTFANTVGQAAWLIAPWFYALMADEKLFTDKVQGARVLAVFIGAAVAVLGVVPAIFCRERFAQMPTAAQTSGGVWKNLLDFFKTFGQTFRCRPFVKLCAATFLVFNGYQLGVSFSLYVMIYYVYRGSDQLGGHLQGLYGTLMSAVTLVIVIPLTGWVATRIGKRPTFFCTIGLSLVGYALKWVGYNPNHPNWLLYAAPLVAFGTGSLFTLMGSMISDVCDYDELQSGQRREGMFGAIYWWMVKVGMSAAGLLAGILLRLSGFDVNLGAAQPEAALFWLRVFDVGIPLATSALAMAVIYTYEIDETRANEIRQILEKRRGKRPA
ncbi:MAG TPA: MFS transporter [Anaerohalosphaeraceae bacterium]|nr:MFS transporter [Anaerohalosphaeraceae bacterium]